jgi:hypothetical protein
MPRDDLVERLEQVERTLDRLGGATSQRTATSSRHRRGLDAQRSAPTRTSGHVSIMNIERRRERERWDER